MTSGENNTAFSSSASSTNIPSASLVPGTSSVPPDASSAHPAADSAERDSTGPLLPSAPVKRRGVLHSSSFQKAAEVEDVLVVSGESQNASQIASRAVKKELEESDDRVGDGPPGLADLSHMDVDKSDDTLPDLIAKVMGKRVDPSVSKHFTKLARELFSKVMALSTTQRQQDKLMKELEELKKGVIPQGCRACPFPFETALLDSVLVPEEFRVGADVVKKDTPIREAKSQAWRLHLQVQRELDVLICKARLAELKIMTKMSVFIHAGTEYWKANRTDFSSLGVDLSDTPLENEVVPESSIRDKLGILYVQTLKRVKDKQLKSSSDAVSRGKSRDELIQEVTCRNPRDLFNQAVDSRVSAVLSSFGLNMKGKGKGKGKSTKAASSTATSTEIVIDGKVVNSSSLFVEAIGATSLDQQKVENCLKSDTQPKNVNSPVQSGGSRARVPSSSRSMKGKGKSKSKSKTRNAGTIVPKAGGKAQSSNPGKGKSSGRGRGGSTPRSTIGRARGRGGRVERTPGKSSSKPRER